MHDTHSRGDGSLQMEIDRMSGYGSASVGH